MLEDWCSLTGNWNSHYKTGIRVSYLATSEQEIKFDITEEVKKWCEDQSGNLESFGVLLKTVDEKEGDYNILLSNDNSLYRNYTKIIIKE